MRRKVPSSQFVYTIVNWYGNLQLVGPTADMFAELFSYTVLYSDTGAFNHRNRSPCPKPLIKQLAQIRVFSSWFVQLWQWQ